MTITSLQEANSYDNPNQKELYDSIEEEPRKDSNDMPPPVDSLESIKARFEQVVSGLPEDIQINLLNEFITQSLEETIPPLVLLSPLETLKKNYTPFPHGVTMSAENIIAHLKIELKDYVKAFGANDDYIYLHEFRKIEKKADSFEKSLSREHQNSKLTSNPIPKLSDLIPTISVRSQKAKEALEQAIKKIEHTKKLSFTLSVTI
jgi:hypothetical protein